MGIEKIGVQGQKFSEKCLAIVKDLHLKYPDIIIQIDGGVGDASIKKLYSAGAVRFVVGSWFTKSSLGIREGVSVLKNLIY
jgi:pentose-5-phosphate-3-epimerase